MFKKLQVQGLRSQKIREFTFVNDRFSVKRNEEIGVFLDTLTTTCPWKGIASYYNLIFEGEKLNDMIWYYPNPSEAAKEIKDRIAFYQKGEMKVIEE